MKKLRRIAAVFILLCFLFSTVAPTLAVPPPDRWLSLRSRNFFLIGNASEREMRRVALRLEQFRHVFSQFATWTNLDSGVPTTVIVFRDDGSFLPYKPLYNRRPAAISGLFQSGADMNYIALDVSSGARGNHAYSVIFHEYVHLLIRNNLPSAPVWFSEGLAEYYSTLEVSDDGRAVTLGATVASHARLFRREHRLMSLADLFAVTRGSPFYNERDRRSVFYAQSWALVHHLMMREGDRRRRPQLARFLDSLRANRPAEDSLREAFQMDAATLERELVAYINRPIYPTEIFRFGGRLAFDSATVSAAISEAETQAYLGDYLLHLDRLDAAEAHLARALALDGNLSSAHTALGLLRFRQNRMSDATAHLRRAAERPAANFLAHYNYSYVLSREGMDATNYVSGYMPETADAMRAHLRRAISLAPQFAESHHLLAFVGLVMNEQLDESIAHARRAIEIAPTDERYQMTLAQLHLRKREFAHARGIIEPLMRNSPQAQVRAAAASMLSAIARMEATQAPATESSPTDPTMFLRRRAEGEMSLRGTLQRIECTPDGVAVIVQTETGVRRFTRDKIERIHLITYTTDVRTGAIGCGARTPPNSVMITYRQATGGRAAANSDGEIVAVEFLPADFDIR